MLTVAPHRATFQQFADAVCRRAGASGWPEIAYQAAFITVVQAETDRRRLEGNSSFWKPEWDTVGDADHTVHVHGGDEAWRVFLGAALYPDLLRADEELQRRSMPVDSCTVRARWSLWSRSEALSGPAEDEEIV